MTALLKKRAILLLTSILTVHAFQPARPFFGFTTTTTTATTTNFRYTIPSGSISSRYDSNLRSSRISRTNDAFTIQRRMSNDDLQESTTTSTTTTSTTTDKDTMALAEAKSLREMAKKARLEAEKMDISLTLEKIAKLESKLNRFESSAAETLKKEETEEKEELSRQLHLLKKHLERPADPPSTATTATTTTAVGKGTLVETFDVNSIPPLTVEERNKRTAAFRDFPPEIRRMFADAVGVEDMNDVYTIVELVHREELAASDGTLDDNTNNDKEEEGGKRREMTPLEKASAHAGYYKLPPLVKTMIAETVGSKNAENATAVIDKLYETGKIETGGDGVQFNLGGREGAGSPPFDKATYEGVGKDVDFEEKLKRYGAFGTLEDATEMFEQLPRPVRTMLASSVGESSETYNETAIVQRLIEEDKMKPTENGIEFMLTDMPSDVEGMEFETENDRYVKTVLPEVTRKVGTGPSQGAIDVFFSRVLSKGTFNPTSRPEKVPGGYVIRGSNLMKSSDELVEALDGALDGTNITEEVQFFYMKDPTLVTEEEVEMDTFELPVLYVTGRDISPNTNKLVKPVVSLFGLVFTFGFALGTFLTNDSFSVDGASADVWLDDIFLPLLLAVILPQLVHETAHQVVAFKDKFKTGVPTIVPSLQLGLQGCITPLKTSPKNLNSLFDFSLAGPLLGMLASITLLYSGLQTQVFMDAATQAQLPTLPVELVRSSSLASGIVEYLLGDGVLLSPDPNALIKLHPYAVGGFLGIVVNALNLLPIGNTDGGRVSISLFGRGFSRIIRGFVVFLMVLAGLFGGDECNVLLFYAVFATIWQKEPEIPCRNEVDGIDDFRAIAAFASAVLVGLAIVPYST